MTRHANRLAALLLGATALTAGALPAAAETVKLTILGVGDVYNFQETHGRGGFARLNAVAEAGARRRTRTRSMSSTATC